MNTSLKPLHMATKKPAAKKAAPKKKKYLGKYASVQIVRLVDSEDKLMNGLMKEIGEKTFNKAVVKIATSYKTMNDELKKLRMEVDKLQDQNGEIVETVGDFIEVTKRLQALKLPKVEKGEEMCDGCYEDFPRSKLQKVDGEMLCSDCR